MRLRVATLLIGLWATLAGCNETNIDEVPLTVGDPVSFATDVQTYVGYRCSSLDCHGDMGRTLRIYSYRGLRLQDALREEGLSPNELGENLLSIAAFDSLGGPVGENQILLKALAVSAGGMAHEGGAVWQSTSEPGYRCLAAWLAQESADANAQAACTEATDAILPDESN
ncbi:MAG: hypothetical protein GY811_02935 [Myxococcales bacterium]|nr:hypothetical protein [Myxococcales bacterium]